jgi:hypothetical protein
VEEGEGYTAADIRAQSRGREGVELDADVRGEDPEAAELHVADGGVQHRDVVTGGCDRGGQGKTGARK